LGGLVSSRGNSCHSETAKLVHHGNLKTQQSPIVLVASVASCSIVASGGCLDASSGTWQNLFDHLDTCTSSLLSGMSQPGLLSWLQPRLPTVTCDTLVPFVPPETFRNCRK
jgi:hypothetical protein